MSTQIKQKQKILNLLQQYSDIHVVQLIHKLQNKVLSEIQIKQTLKSIEDKKQNAFKFYKNQYKAEYLIILPCNQLQIEQLIQIYQFVKKNASTVLNKQTQNKKFQTSIKKYQTQHEINEQQQQQYQNVFDNQFGDSLNVEQVTKNQTKALRKSKIKQALKLQTNQISQLKVINQITQSHTENPQIQGQFQKNNQNPKYLAQKQQLKKYLIAVYHEYCKQTFMQLQSFQKNQQRKQLIDLRIFLKYYKDFNVSQMMKLNQVTKIFKNQATNRIWLDLDKFILVNYKINQTKSKKKNKDYIDFVQIQNSQQLIQRIQQFLALFSKEKIKKCLKINNKTALQKIIQEYNKRQIVSDQHQGNRDQIIDKFLKRNFDAQLPKWYDKKQIDFNKFIKKKGNFKKTRDQKLISNDIEQLRSQSQKNINQLRSLLNDDMQLQLQEKLSLRKKPQKTQSYEQVRNKKPKVQKFNNGNVASIYEQLKKYNPAEINLQKRNLKAQLKLNDDQPFLEAYLNRKNLNHSKINNRNQVQQFKINDVPIQSNLRLDLNSNEMYKNLLKKSAAKNFVSENNLLKNKKINYAVQQLRNDFGSIQNNFLRSKHNRSSPEHTNVNETINKNRRRQFSMKKLSKNILLNNEQINSPQIEAKLKININKKNDRQLINMNILKYLQQNLDNDNDNQVNDQMTENKKLKDKRQNNKKKQFQNNKSLNILKLNQKQQVLDKKPTQVVKEQANKNNLMENFNQQIYDLFKYFKRIGKEERQIIKKVTSKQKQKGYLIEKNKSKILLRIPKQKKLTNLH